MLLGLAWVRSEQHGSIQKALHDGVFSNSEYHSKKCRFMLLQVFNFQDKFLRSYKVIWGHILFTCLLSRGKSRGKTHKIFTDLKPSFFMCVLLLNLSTVVCECTLGVRVCSSAKKRKGPWHDDRYSMTFWNFLSQRWLWTTYIKNIHKIISVKQCRGSKILNCRSFMNLQWSWESSLLLRFRSSRWSQSLTQPKATTETCGRHTTRRRHGDGDGEKQGRSELARDPSCALRLLSWALALCTFKPSDVRIHTHWCMLLLLEYTF